MKKFDVVDINNPRYWDTHQTALDFGIRQQEYERLSKGTVVDLGCGLSPFIDKMGGVGVDYSPETIKKCKEMYKNATFVCSDVLHTPFEDQSFDTAVSGEVIEHLEDPGALVLEMLRIARKRIIISTPHLEFDDPEHLWEFDEEDFTKLGFRVITIKSHRFKGREYLVAYRDL